METENKTPNEIDTNSCAICNKKLKLVNNFKCKCQYHFCKIHKFPEEHNCSFNYKLEGKNLLEKNNPIIKCEKINIF